MSSRALLIAAAAATSMVFLCAVMLGAITGSGTTAACGRLDQPAQPAPASQWNARQTTNAAIIVRVGARLGVPYRGWVIAVATAMQESGLRNLHGGDRDSLGLFQQRPSQGWGSAARILNPAHSAAAFYAALQKVPGWQHLPLTVAAQHVQRSAYPDAYATWETSAARLVADISLTAPSAGSTCAANSVPAASGWVAPVQGPISSPFGPRGGVMHFGVDLAPPRGTTIHAAAGGLVITATCDPATGTCDTDGSINTAGCGWYVEIRHADGVNTRYCHMAQQPLVHVGQTVTAGQAIGHVGMSGNADGPHLHFEVHLHNDLSSAGAIDPVPFMKDKGAPVGRVP